MNTNLQDGLSKTEAKKFLGELVNMKETNDPKIVHLRDQALCVLNNDILDNSYDCNNVLTPYFKNLHNIIYK